MFQTPQIPPRRMRKEQPYTLTRSIPENTFRLFVFAPPHFLEDKSKAHRTGKRWLWKYRATSEAPQRHSKSHVQYAHNNVHGNVLGLFDIVECQRLD